MANEPKTTADLTYEQYEILGPTDSVTLIPKDDLRDVDTITTQSISEMPLKSDVEFYLHEDVNVTEERRDDRIESKNEVLGSEEVALEDVPDADEIHMNSPIDPAAPPVEVVHGTDLLNGYGGDHPED